MRIFVTARYNPENSTDVDMLCDAVRKTGHQDYCFVRDVEKIDDPKELWQRALEEIKKSDCLLVDVSDAPSGGRVLEAGIAFALHIPVVVVAKTGTTFKDIFTGISDKILFYDQYSDLTPSLQKLPS